MISTRGQMAMEGTAHTGTITCKSTLSDSEIRCANDSYTAKTLYYALWLQDMEPFSTYGSCDDVQFVRLDDGLVCGLRRCRGLL